MPSACPSIGDAQKRVRNVSGVLRRGLSKRRAAETAYFGPTGTTDAEKDRRKLSTVRVGFDNHLILVHFLFYVKKQGTM